MVRSASLIGVLLLCGCSDIPRAQTENEIREIAKTAPRNDIAALQSEVADLRDEIARIKETDKFQTKWLVKAFDGAAQLEKQLNDNASVANTNAVKDMTRRGACGYRSVTENLPKGMIVRQEPIPCTLQDLQK